jgi:hypothetical protein
VPATQIASVGNGQTQVVDLATIRINEFHGTILVSSSKILRINVPHASFLPRNISVNIYNQVNVPLASYARCRYQQEEVLKYQPPLPSLL